MVYCNRNCRGCHVDAPGTKNEVRVIDLAFLALFVQYTRVWSTMYRGGGNQGVMLLGVAV